MFKDNDPDALDVDMLGHKTPPANAECRRWRQLSDSATALAGANNVPSGAYSASFELTDVQLAIESHPSLQTLCRQPYHASKQSLVVLQQSWIWQGCESRQGGVMPSKPLSSQGVQCQIQLGMVPTKAAKGACRDPRSPDSDRHRVASIAAMREKHCAGNARDKSPSPLPAALPIICTVAVCPCHAVALKTACRRTKKLYETRDWQSTCVAESAQEQLRRRRHCPGASPAQR